MGYTIKNLRDIEDVAASREVGEVQEARFARRDLEAEQTGLALQLIKPGRRQGFAHRHQNAEEIYVVLSGSGRVKLDDEVRELQPMDAVRVAPEVARAFEAGEQGLELLVFGPHHERDGQMISGEEHWRGAPGS